MIERLIQHKEAKLSAVFVSRPCPSTIIYVLHKCGSASTALKCFSPGVHLANLNCADYQPLKQF